MEAQLPVELQVGLLDIVVVVQMIEVLEFVRIADEMDEEIPVFELPQMDIAMQLAYMAQYGMTTLNSVKR